MDFSRTENTSLKQQINAETFDDKTMMSRITKKNSENNNVIFMLLV